MSIDHTTEVSAFLNNLDDIHVMRLDNAVYKAQAAGDFIPSDLTDALDDEVAARCAKATKKANCRHEPALAILWYLHMLERNSRQFEEKPKTA